jgi:hypothetical protein
LAAFAAKDVKKKVEKSPLIRMSIDSQNDPLQAL